MQNVCYLAPCHDLIPYHAMADLLDQLLPDNFAQDDVQDRLVGLSQADGGEGVKEGEQALHQLRAPPELYLSLT